MAQTAIQQLEGCIEALQQGALTEERLRQVIETLRRGGAGQQELLYLQADQTSVAAQVIGLSLVQGGAGRRTASERSMALRDRA